MKLEVRRLGLVDFDAAWALQRELEGSAARGRGVLLLLEHPPVFTLGRNADERNVLDAGGVPVRRIDRGGDVTWHGPGQLVGYPVVDVRRIGVKRFVRALEEALIAAIAGFGVPGWRREKTAGVWASGGKIASIGLRVRRGISTHGFALNVSNDLAPFRRIHPCGDPGCAMTSLSIEAGRAVTVDEVSERFRLPLP